MAKLGKADWLKRAGDHQKAITKHRKQRNAALAKAQHEGALLREMAAATGLVNEGVRKAIAQHQEEEE